VNPANPFGVFTPTSSSFFEVPQKWCYLDIYAASAPGADAYKFNSTRAQRTQSTQAPLLSDSQFCALMGSTGFWCWLLLRIRGSEFLFPLDKRGLFGAASDKIVCASLMHVFSFVEFITWHSFISCLEQILSVEAGRWLPSTNDYNLLALPSGSFARCCNLQNVTLQPHCFEAVAPLLVDPTDSEDSIEVTDAMLNIMDAIDPAVEVLNIVDSPLLHQQQQRLSSESDDCNFVLPNMQSSDSEESDAVVAQASGTTNVVRSSTLFCTHKYALAGNVQPSQEIRGRNISSGDRYGRTASNQRGRHQQRRTVLAETAADLSPILSDSDDWQ
jgi:hypothetical protein